jgi:hypothetical protein
LRFFRPDPAKIKAGDAITIPANAVKEAQKKLDNLRKIREDCLTMNNKILSDWGNEVSKVKNTASTVDTIATVALIFKDLGGIIKDGFSAMKLSGRKLEEANKELAKSAIKFGYTPIKDVVEEIASDSLLEVKPGDGMGYCFGKKILHFFLVDFDKPSFWASIVTGTDIESINRKVTEEIKNQKEHSLKELDTLISKAEMELRKLQGAQKGHIPVLL